MGFRARVYIHGVGHIRLSDDKKRLEGYFPSSRSEKGFKLLSALPDPPDAWPRKPAAICEHHLFAQFSAQNLGQAEDVWLTMMLDHTDVEVEASGPNVAPLDLGGGHVEGLASLAGLLRGTGVRSRVLRKEIYTQDIEKRISVLDGTLRLEAGKARAVSQRVWRLEALEGGSKPRDLVRMSGVVLVELGMVETLSLHATSFDGNERRRIELAPKKATNDVDLWIRHFCDLSRPDVNPSAILERGSTDWDFVLNYALLEDVRDMTIQEKRKLPIPTISDGGQIGGNHTFCQSVG